MSDSQNADRNRRLMLSAGGAALALGAVGSADAAVVPKTPKYSIARTRYGTTAEADLPTAGGVYVLPLDTTNFTDSNTNTTLDATNNVVTIVTDGLYRVSMSVDWPGQHGVDNALRTYGIRRVKAGSPAPVATPGSLTLVPDTDQHLATQDITGSSAPQSVRFPQPGTAPFAWTPGVIPMGGHASIDITMPTTGIVAVGDMAMASLTSLNDAALGVAATTALVLDAKVIAADTVRVTLTNPTIAAGVNVPAGDLYVIGMNAATREGGSADAWTVLSTPMIQLLKGDVIYCVFSSLTPGDFMQTSDQIYLQFDLWVQGTSKL